MLCLSLHTMRPNCRVWSEGSMAPHQCLSALSGARVACGCWREGCRAELTSRAMATPHPSGLGLLAAHVLRGLPRFFLGGASNSSPVEHARREKVGDRMRMGLITCSDFCGVM